VNPDTSTKAKLRWTLTRRCCHAPSHRSQSGDPRWEEESQVVDLTRRSYDVPMTFGHHGAPVSGRND